MELVTIAANVAGSVFNESHVPYLWFLHDLGVTLRVYAHNWANVTDEEWIKLSERQAESQTMEARVKHRQAQKDKLDAQNAAGPCLYGACIDDSA